MRGRQPISTLTQIQYTTQLQGMLKTFLCMSLSPIITGLNSNNLFKYTVVYTLLFYSSLK